MKIAKLLILLGLLAGCVAAPTYQGDALSNFDGDTFFNTVRMNKTPIDTMKMAWGWIRYAETWPDFVPITAKSIDENRVYDGVSVTFINHSTILIQVDGINILTDPVFAERASPFTWAGPKRVHDPGIALVDLPEIDVILISHNHYDHLDAAALKDLFARQKTPPMLLAGLGNSGLFSELGLENFHDLQWDQQIKYKNIEFIFVECRHRSGRGLADQMKTLWGSFVVKTSEGNIYFAGDTGYSPHFEEQGKRYGEFALTILPIGAYEPRWFMADIHLDPEEAVLAHKALNSRQSLAIHYGTFQLTFEAIDQPAADLAVALAQENVDSDKFWVAEPGETFVLD